MLSMVRKDNSDVNSLVDEVRNHYNFIEEKYEDCYSESFEINNENVRLLEDIDRHSEELFNLLCKLADYITDGNRVNVGHQNMTIRDEFVYRYSSSKKITEDNLYGYPIIKEAVRENCSSEDLADKFDEAYDLSKYVHDVFSSTKYSGVSGDERIPISFSYKGDSDRQGDTEYVIYKPRDSEVDEIRFKPYRRSSLMECFKKSRVCVRINRDDSRTKEEYLRQIWYSDVVHDAIIESNKKIKAAHEIVSEAEDKILDNFSHVLVSNSI